jgi:DNA-binding transcriptional LysR family regulator
VRVAAGGELLFHRARAVLDELDVARAELAELAGVISGRLRLGMVGSTGQAAPVVERTSPRFTSATPPSRSPSATTGSRQMAEQVRAGELDMAFVGLFPWSAAGWTSRTKSSPTSARRRNPCRPSLAEGPADLAALRRRERLRRDARRVRAAAAGRRCFLARGRRSPGEIAFELTTSDAVVRFVALGFGSALVPLLSGHHPA